MTIPAGKNRLSVAVIVRDAAESLRLTLASVRPLAAEIIVVDTGSTDRTREVASEFGARVFYSPWSDDFSAARNFAWDQATGEWILWLDAGETLNESDVGPLREFIDVTASSACAYMLLVRVPPIDAHSAIEQIGQVRLIPNHPAIRFAGRVRESCGAALKILQMSIVAAPFVVERGVREHEPRVKKQRAQRNIRLAEREQREQGFSARLWNCLGDAWQTAGQNQRASDYYHQALTVSDRGSAEQLEAYYGLLTLADSAVTDMVTDNCAASATTVDLSASAATSTVAEQRSIDPLNTCVQALEVFPLDSQLLCFLGGALQTRGHAQLAIQAYRTAYQFGQVEPSVWHIAEVRDVAATCYSICLQLQNQEQEALRFLEQAVQENPNSLKVRRHLIELHVNRGEREAALSHVSQLPPSFANKEAFRSAVRGACYARQKNWLAARSYLQTAYGHGCRDTLCLRWLAATLLASGEVEAARPMLEQWCAAEPRNLEPARVLKSIAEKKSLIATDRSIRVDRPAAPMNGTAIPLNFGAPSQISRETTK